MSADAASLKMASAPSSTVESGLPPNCSNTGVPPRGERRFVADEIITAFSPSTSTQTVDEIARRYNLTQLESQGLPLIGVTIYRWRIASGRSLADVVGAVENERTVVSAQPNYVFTLQEQPAAIAAEATGDPAQYVLQKLQVHEAHELATGKSVLIAVIDSEIDTAHPDLGGAIVKSFDAVGGNTDPHQHGTAIAGAIASHGKSLGIAPGVQLFSGTRVRCNAGGSQRHIIRDPQGAAMGGRQRCPRREHEFRGSGGSGVAPHASGRVRQRACAGGGGRECGAEFATALSGR